MAVGISAKEPYSEETTLGDWNPIWPSTLNPPPEPNNRTFWGRYMPDNSWLQLNLSSSGLVRVTVSMITQGGDSFPMFNQVGTRFTQRLGIATSGTYQVDIINEGTNAVDIGGDVTAKQSVTEYRTVFPNLTLGTIVTCVGIASLVLGVILKPRKGVKRKVKR